MTREIGALRTPATIEALSETETALGGRAVSWTEVGTIWIAPGVRAVRERSPSAPGFARETSAPPRLEEGCVAEARAHPQAVRGRRLSIDGAAWRIAASEPAEAGRVRLHLIKD